MSENLDPVVFEVLAEVQTAIDAVLEVADVVRTMAAEVASSMAEVSASNAMMSDSYAGAAMKVEEDSAKIKESTHSAGLGFKEMAEMAGLFAAADFLKESVKVAADGAQAQAVLAQSIRNTGVAYNEEMGKSVESVDEQMRHFGFTNAETNQQMAIMIQTVHNAAEGENLMGLAANVAAGRHMSLERATRLVAMAASGHVAMLARMGIQTKDAAGKTLTAKEAIDKLAQTFRGDAATSANTAAGQMKSFTAEIDDAKEKVGNALIPVIRALLPVVLTLVQDLATFLVPILKIVSGMVSQFSGVLKILVPAIIAVLVVTKVAAAVKAFWLVLQANPIMAIVSIITVLILWLVHLYETNQKVREVVDEVFHFMRKIIGDTVYAIIEYLKMLVDSWLHTIKALADGINDLDFTGTTDSARKAIDNFVSSTDNTMQSWADNAKNWGNQVAGSVNQVANAHAAAAAVVNTAKTDISSGYSNMVTNLPVVQASHVAHQTHLKNHHSKVQASQRKHYEEMLRMAREQAKKREELLRAQLAAQRAQLQAARDALKHDAQQDIQIVNGMFANVGTSLLNLGYGSGPSNNPPPPVIVNVSGSVTTQQNLVTAIQSGLLTQQRTNSSLGIVGK